MASFSFSKRITSSLNETKDGEILAVSGPPGTGKTTLLQSVVADLFVKHAKEGLKAPIIVATSTNNKAVTNIMDSFANVVEEDSDKNEKRKLLERRWIGLSSFRYIFLLMLRRMIHILRRIKKVV